MKSILIIGLGEFGKHLALECSKQKNEVCVVDSSKDLIDEISSCVTKSYVADCMKKSTLTELGVNNYDVCVVAIGKNFQASLEITSNLKELGAKHIIAKVVSELQSKFLIMAGADETVYPEKEIAHKVAVKCNTSNLMDYIAVSEDYNIVELKVPEDWIGKTLSELNIRKKYNLNIVAVTNNGVVIMPDGDYSFKSEDCLFIFGKTSQEEKLIKKEI